MEVVMSFKFPYECKDGDDMKVEGKVAIGASTTDHQTEVVTNNDTATRIDGILSTYNYNGDAPQPTNVHAKGFKTNVNVGVGTEEHRNGSAWGVGSSVCIYNTDAEGRGEFTPYYGSVTAKTKADLWGMDLNVVGPKNAQATGLRGIVNFICNRNPDPIIHPNWENTPLKSVGMAIVTKDGGRGSEACGDQSTQKTYPIDYGLVIAGRSTGGTSPGFKTALKIGGSTQGAWMTPLEDSYLNTGIEITEYDTCGLNIHDGYGGIAISIDVGSGINGVVEYKESGNRQAAVYNSANANAFCIDICKPTDGSNQVNAFAAKWGQEGSDPVAKVGIMTNNPTARLDVNGKSIRIRNSQTPSGTSPGNPGEISWDQNYLYVCVGTNSWKRISLSSF